MTGSSIKVSKLAAFVTRYKTLVVVLALLITCGMGAGMTRIQTEVILSDLFPQDHPYLQLMEKFSKIFGGFGSGVIIGVKAKEGDIFVNSCTTEKIGNRFVYFYSFDCALLLCCVVVGCSRRA